VLPVWCEYFNRKQKLSSLSFFYSSALLSFSLAAEEASFTDIFVSAQRGNELLVVTRLKGCFTPKIEAAILAGVPTSFTFVAELCETRPWWLDRKIMKVTELRTIKYDLIKKIFYVTTGNSPEPLTFHDFDAAKRAMSEYSIIIPLEENFKKLAKNSQHYYVRMKAKLDKVQLPLKLEYLLFFVSLWDFETAWYHYPVNFH